MRQRLRRMLAADEFVHPVIRSLARVRSPRQLQRILETDPHRRMLEFSVAEMGAQIAGAARAGVRALRGPPGWGWAGRPSLPSARCAQAAGEPAVKATRHLVRNVVSEFAGWTRPWSRRTRTGLSPCKETLKTMRPPTH